MYDALVAALARLGPKAQEKILDLARRSIGDKNKLAEKFPTIRGAADLHILLADEEILAIIADLFRTRGVGISRIGTIPQSGALVNPRQSHKKVVKTLKKYVGADELIAIDTSYSIIRLEQESHPTTESLRNAREAKERFFRPAEDFRRRIYNDCLSGWIEDVLYEKALDLEWATEPSEKISEAIQKALKESTYSNPMNIYVNDFMPDDELKAKIHTKFAIEQRVMVRVYARSRNWARVQQIGIQYAEAKGLLHHREERVMGLIGGGCVRIWRSEHGKAWPELERMLIESFRERM